MSQTINKSGLLDVDVGQVLTSCWHWWRREIVEALPPELVQWLRQDNRRLIIRPTAATLQFVSSFDLQHVLYEILIDNLTVDNKSPDTNTNADASASTDTNIIEEIINDINIAHLQSINDAARPFGLDLNTTAIQLPQGMVLHRNVSLPLAARNNLSNILGFQMSSLTPWSKGQVYYGWRVQGTTGSMLNLTLYVCSRRQVDPIIHPLEKLGIHSHDLITDDGLLVKNFFAPAEQINWRNEIKKPLPWLCFFALVSLVFVSWLPLHFMSHEKTILEKQMQRERTQALEASTLRQQLNQIITETDFLAKIINDHIPTFVSIDDMTEQLPLNAWVYMLRRTGKEISVWGLAKSVKDVQDAMKKTQYWQRATFDASANDGNTGGDERFQMHVNLEQNEPDKTTKKAKSANVAKNETNENED